jgi:uncharacterized protein YjbJ (UPF0337 family)
MSRQVVYATEEVMDMNKDIARGNFNQIKGKLKQQWGKLTDDEIDQMEGNADILIGKLQERYGWDRAEAERQAKEFQRQNNWH